MVSHKLQSILSDRHIWDWHKISVLMDRCNSYKELKKMTEEWQGQLDFGEVPYLSIVRPSAPARCSM